MPAFGHGMSQAGEENKGINLRGSLEVICKEVGRKNRKLSSLEQITVIAVTQQI